VVVSLVEFQELSTLAIGGPNIFSFFSSFPFMLYLKRNHSANAVWMITRIKGGPKK
jgi:hypothetical protein